MQYHILEIIALNGKLSKGEIEKIVKDDGKGHHPDIVDAVNGLEKKNYIIKSGKKNQRGPAAFFYKITLKGLEFAIKGVSCNVSKFWMMLVSYCHYSTELIKDEEIVNLFSLFMDDYLLFRNKGISYQIDIFNMACKRWLDEFFIGKTLKNEQKVLETLSLHRKLTICQISHLTGITESEVRRILLLYSLEEYSPLKTNRVHLHQNVVGKVNDERYWDFLLHCTVSYTFDKASEENQYELSTFGIMLVFAVIRLAKNAKSSNNFLQNDGISLFDYFDKIVDNYNDKLPLIFGKWNTIKKALGNYAYHNFDIITDDKLRNDESSKISVIRGGNKELLEGSKEIILYNRAKLGTFANVGKGILLDYLGKIKDIPDNNFFYWKVEEDRNKYQDKRADSLTSSIKAVMALLSDLLANLNPLEFIFDRNGVLSFKKESGEIVKEQEKMFEFEVYALYYFNLYFEFEFNSRLNPLSNGRYIPFMHNKGPSIYNYFNICQTYSLNALHGSSFMYVATFQNNRENYGQIPIGTPKDFLNNLLKMDEQNPKLIDWFDGVLTDIKLYYKNVGNILENVYN